MKLIEYLQVERGRAARVASAIKLAAAYVSQIANEVRPIPIDKVPAMEVACEFAVRRWDLRPNDWHLIWPELIGTDGAPDPGVPASAEASHAG